MSKRSNLGELEQILLLAVLQCGDEAYGLSIQEELRTSISREISLGAIYTSLDRMVRKGYLSSKLGDVTTERGGRPRRYFQVEAGGIQAVRESQNAVRTMARGLEESLGGTI